MNLMQPGLIRYTGVPLILAGLAGCTVQPPATFTAPEPAPAAPPTPAPGRALRPPPGDNVRPPHIAVYKGCVNGRKDPYGAVNNAHYAAWLNRQVVWALDYQPGASWEHMTGHAWQLEPWSDWKKAVPGRRLVLHLCIIPGPWNGEGPKTGPMAGEPVSLEDGAAGKYNRFYHALALSLVKYHLDDTILRPGCEFNGGWFAWRAQNPEKAKAYAGYFRQIVTTMRAVPGAEKLQFDWNVSLGWCAFDPETAWPGDDVVDYVGVDAYDECYAKNTYPFPPNSTEEEKDLVRRKVWHEHLLNGKFSLNYWSAFAQRHGKPLSIPEWGVNNKPDGHGGGDNPYYIEQMHAFINNPSNHVGYHSYFCFQAGDGHHQLSPKSDGTIIGEFPRAAARFRELFSLPGTPEQKGLPREPLPVK